MKKIICAIAVAGLTVSAVLFASVTYAEEYTMAIVPRQSPKVIYSRWMPVVKEIERSTGITIKMRFYKNIVKFRKALFNDEFDIAFVNPYWAYRLGKSGYTPLVRNGKKKLAGVLVVKKSSGITSVKQLEGMKIAFPSKHAWGASLYLRALLKSQHKVSFTPVYVKNHDASYHSAAAGVVSAAGGVMRTFKGQRPVIKDRLKVLWKTPGTTPHALVAKKTVSKKLQAEITAALINFYEMNPSAMSKAIKNPIKANYARDYAHFSKYQVEKVLAAK